MLMTPAQSVDRSTPTTGIGFGVSTGMCVSVALEF